MCRALFLLLGGFSGVSGVISRQRRKNVHWLQVLKRLLTLFSIGLFDIFCALLYQYFPYLRIISNNDHTYKQKTHEHTDTEVNA